MDRLTNDDTLKRLLGPAEPELLCDECFEKLDEYVELRTAGRARRRAHPGDARPPRGLPRLPRGLRQPARARPERRLEHVELPATCAARLGEYRPERGVRWGARRRAQRPHLSEPTEPLGRHSRARCLVAARGPATPQVRRPSAIALTTVTATDRRRSWTFKSIQAEPSCPARFWPQTRASIRTGW